MSLGEKIKVICPAEKVYGKNAVGDIPPNTDFEYILELVNFPKENE
jgi:FKBP-type peptidyl-prolyl cis-trans isomerase